MVGVLDSGVGGLSVWKELIETLPNEKYVYVADSGHCPYGPRAKSYIIERTFKISEFLIEKGADIIVVACNTATAAAISSLRKEFSDRRNPEVRQRVSELSGGRRDHVLFIGMEPAVKPAVAMTKTGVIGVLATYGTLKGEKYRHSRELADDKVKVVEHVGSGFVELVEKGELTGPHAEQVVKASLKPLMDEGADTIVLGCTHYPFLLDTIRRIAGPEVTVIDPAPAVARHRVDVMNEDGIKMTPGGKPGVFHDKVILLASGSDQNLKSAFENLSLS